MPYSSNNLQAKQAIDGNSQLRAGRAKLGFLPHRDSEIPHLVGVAAGEMSLVGVLQ